MYFIFVEINDQQVEFQFRKVEEKCQSLQFLQPPRQEDHVFVGVSLVS